MKFKVSGRKPEIWIFTGLSVHESSFRRAWTTVMSTALQKEHCSPFTAWPCGLNQRLLKPCSVEEWARTSGPLVPGSDPLVVSCDLPSLMQLWNLSCSNKFCRKAMSGYQKVDHTAKQLLLFLYCYHVCPWRSTKSICSDSKCCFFIVCYCCYKIICAHPLLGYKVDKKAVLPSVMGTS